MKTDTGLRNVWYGGRLHKRTPLSVRGVNWRLWSLLVRDGRSLCWLRFAFMPLGRMGECATGKCPLYELSVKTVWEPRDLWMGLFWDRTGLGKTVLYLCVIPCLPLRLHFKRLYGAGGIA